MSGKIVIIGGHGKIALRLAKLLAQKTFAVTSVIRDAAHASDISAVAATPHVLSLEQVPVSTLTALFQHVKVVYFAAGAGGKGGPERTKAVDFDGAVKVFDAIDAVEGAKPRLILVSALDVRNPDSLDQCPAHYTVEDQEHSRRAHAAIGNYYKWKYEADKNLFARKEFQWTVLRPGGLLDDPGTGMVAIGRTRLASVPRDDVAATLALLVDRPDAHGLALDLIGGDTPIGEALDAAIKKGETDFTP